MSSPSAYCGSKAKVSGPQLCKWSGCEAYGNCTEFDSVEELARHVRTTHVEPLESQDVVVCQWEKCKVYNVPSSSIQWLKRHVQQAHTKDRPFKCIMNGCIMAFNSREALQRHVNRHLEPSVPPASSPASGSPRQGHPKTGRGGGKMVHSKRIHPSPFVSSPYPSLYQLYTDPPSHTRFDAPSDSSYDSSEENGRKIMGRKKALSLKIKIPRHSISLLSLNCPAPYNGAHIHTDVWDRKMMSVVRHACNKLTHDSLPSSSKGLSITLKAKILGKRSSLAEEDELLVRWTPHLADDCWVPVSQFSAQKSVPLSQISEPHRSLLISSCFFHCKRGRKTKNS